MMKDELSKRVSLVDNSIARTEKILYNQYLKSAKSLELRLRALYQNIEDDGDTALLSHLYQYNRYYDLLNTLQEELTKLGNYEKKELEQGLTKLYLDNSKVISSYGNNFTPFINNNLVKEVVNENWGGRAKSWSDSIWSNKAEIAERIRDDFIDILATGKSYREVSTILSKDLGVAYHQAQRLVRTEMARVAIQSSLDTYASIGIDKVRVITADDMCSEVCEEHKGNIVPIMEAEVGINIPPFHPNCRCDIVAVWEDDNVQNEQKQH